MPTTTHHTQNESGNKAYTYHREPQAQGGKRYVRCTSCTREVLGSNPERILHTEDCPHSEPSHPMTETH